MSAESPTTPRRSKSAADAVVGWWAVIVGALLMALLYFARDILIPLALAVLFSFLLTPLVVRLDRRIGRIAAVLGAVLLTFACAAVTDLLLSRQLADFTTNLPGYQSALQTKLPSVKIPDASSGGKLDTALQSIIAPSLKSIAMAALVLVLASALLLCREDLRNRLLRLMGHGPTSATARALDDAGARISRYLRTQLLVNFAYGVLIALGLSVIGVPHAILWGMLAIPLRFIPYAGIWIAALLPTALALAISTGWTMPLLTVGLFALENLAVNRVTRPMISGADTGVAPLALIVAAIFWSWLWGPTSLLIAAPLTVCLVMIGRHVPRLKFLSILLCDEQSLTPAEECYQRLLALETHETSKLIDEYIQKNSLTALYDSVLMPVVTAAEVDHSREMLDDQQRQLVEESVSDFVEDLGTRSFPSSQIPVDPSVADKAAPAWRFLILPVRDQRDELAGAMLSHLLREQGFPSENLSAEQASGDAVLTKSDLDAVCISVVPPSTVLQARYLCMKLRSQSPALKIAVGLWGATENLADATERLREAGADEVVTTFADAVQRLARLTPPAERPMPPAPIPDNEAERLESLGELHLINGKTEPYFDRATRKLARVLDVPIALVTLVDRERQIFKGQTGLPEELAAAGESPRETSVCAHIVAGNKLMIVEDVRRDDRFAANPLLKRYGIRFYAGLPLHSPDGQPVGSLSILDIHPRQLTERDVRLLQVVAEDVIEEIARHAEAAESKADNDTMEQQDVVSPEPSSSSQKASPSSTAP